MLECLICKEFLGVLSEYLHHTLQHIVKWCVPSGFESCMLHVRVPLIAQHSVGSHSMGHMAISTVMSYWTFVLTLAATLEGSDTNNLHIQCHYTILSAEAGSLSMSWFDGLTTQCAIFRLHCY
jgi:hypothetical protein